jgi:hypothetical protein
METKRLFLIENKKVLNFAFENQRDFRQRQRRCVDFSTLDVPDLVVAYTGFNGKLILGYAAAHPQLAQPLTQPAPKSILLFRGHGSKLPLTAVPDRPIYRAKFQILFLPCRSKKGPTLSWNLTGFRSDTFYTKNKQKTHHEKATSVSAGNRRP